MIQAITNFIIAVIALLRKPTTEPETVKPMSTRRITKPALRGLLLTRFPKANIYLSDNTYSLCNPNDIALFLAQDKTNKMDYVAEERDCDDFSYRLMGQFSIPNWSALTFGICWTEVHALNCFVDEDNKIWFIEPQIDKISQKLDVWQGETVRLIVM